MYSNLKIAGIVLKCVLVLMVSALAVASFVLLVSRPKRSRKAADGPSYRLDTDTETVLAIENNGTTTGSQDFTLAFDVYLNSFTQTTARQPTGTALDKFVMSVTSNPAGLPFSDANVVVFMDGMFNRLHVAIKADYVTQSGMRSNASLNSIRARNFWTVSDAAISDPSTNTYVITSLPFVPIGKVTEVTVVLSSGVIMLYANGNLVSAADAASTVSAQRLSAGLVFPSLPSGLVMRIGGAKLADAQTRGANVDGWVSNASFSYVANNAVDGS